MKREICLVIDKLTDCIEEISTGEKKETILEEASLKDFVKLGKKWLFNWKTEFQVSERKVYKLLIKYDTVIQGLISIEARDGYFEMHLIESAPHNFGSKKKYSGVAGNLVAFICKKSFEFGFDGAIVLTAKTKLIEHYKKMLGATVVYGNRMMISSKAAEDLVNLYYKDFFQ